ncbi:MAG: hypothetical protein ACLP66_24590 [Polyangia bacterium]
MGQIVELPEVGGLLSPPARRGTFFVGITGNQGTTFLAHFSAVFSDRFRVCAPSARPLTAAGA